MNNDTTFNLQDAGAVVAGLMLVGAILKHAVPQLPNRWIPLITMVLGVPAYVAVSTGFESATVQTWITAVLVSATATGAHSGLKNTFLGGEDSGEAKPDTKLPTMLCLIGLSLALAGCVTPAPGADPLVVQAEALAENSATSLDAFVQWEYRNRALVGSDVTAAADLVREYAPTYIRTLRASTLDYKRFKSGDNANKLQAAINTLQSLLDTVRAYYIKKVEK